MENTIKTLVIKPVTKSKFSGQSSYSNTATSVEGAQLGKGGYKTGLTREEEVKFEQELNLPKGHLSKNNKTFWASVLGLRLPNDKSYTIVLDLSDPMDLIKYKVIQERSNIANNETELAKNPQAEFFIEDKEAKAHADEVVINYKMEANEAFTSLTGEEKKGYLKLYGKKGVNGMSDVVIKTQLFKEVENDSKKFLSYFNNPDVKVRIEIEEMIEAGTLLKKGQYYQFEDEVIGNSVEAVIAFFKDLKNQSIKIAAKAATKNNKKED